MCLLEHKCYWYSYSSKEVLKLFIMPLNKKDETKSTKVDKDKCTDVVDVTIPLVFGITSISKSG